MTGQNAPSSEGSSGNQRHVIVTGGAGFVGSHLVDALLEDGAYVTVLDNYGSGRRHNLEHHDGSTDLTVLEHDVRDRLPEFDSVDLIYHLASRASPIDFDTHPVDIALTNSVGTRNVYDCARTHDAPVVLTSTSEVYGNPTVHPQPETYNGNVDPRGPRGPYDEGKRFAEALGFAYEREYGLDFRTIRVFNTYGPRMRVDDGRVVPTFLMQALEGEELTVYGDGTQTRSFCYVSDLVHGLLRVGNTPTMAGDVVNLGSTNEITIETLAEHVIEIVDDSLGIRYLSRPASDPDLRRPEIDKATRKLGWKPTVPLKYGLERTVEYFADVRRRTQVND